MRFVVCSVVYSVRRVSLLGTGRGAPFRRFISYFLSPLVPRRPCARGSRTARRRNRSSSSIVLRRRGSRGSYSGIQRGGAPLLPGEEDGPADFRDHDHRQRVADEQQQGPAFLERCAVVHKQQQHYGSEEARCENGAESRTSLRTGRRQGWCSVCCGATICA